MNVAKRLLGGSIGFVGKPISELAKVAVLVPSLALLTMLLVPTLAIGFGAAAYAVSGFWPAFFTTLLSAAALGVIASLVLPVIAGVGILQALKAIFIAPFQGWRKGWNEGPGAILKDVLLLKSSAQQVSEQAPGHAPAPAQAAQQNGFGLGSMMNILGMFYNHGVNGIQALGVAAQQAGPLTEQQFNGLSLSETEITALRNDRLPPLTENEKARLQQSAEDATTLTAYTNLERLKTDHCPVLYARPARNDTVLLVKQYRVGEGNNATWLPVPGAAHVFDRASLKAALMNNGKNPITNEFVRSPANYVVDGASRPTRIVMHDYYLDGAHLSPEVNEQEGTCQELNLLTRRLRERLDVLQPVAVHDGNMEEHGQFSYTV